MSKYLILGASSEVAIAFMNLHAWTHDDEIFAQYYSHNYALQNTHSKVSRARIEAGVL